MVDKSFIGDIDNFSSVCHSAFNNGSVIALN